MLVTFHTDAWSSITMFGDVAVSLLKMAGHSGTVPSALRAADVPAALAALNRALAATPQDPEREAADTDDKDGDSRKPVGIHLRAFPLVQLLTAAAAQNRDVMWDAGAPLV